MQDPNQTDCKQIAEMLSAFRDMELTPDEADMVEAHLLGCPQCKAELAAIEIVVAKLKSLPQLPERDFADAIEARIIAAAVAAPAQGQAQPDAPGSGQDLQSMQPAAVSKAIPVSGAAPALSVVADNVRPMAPGSRRFNARAAIAAAAIMLGIAAMAAIVPKSPSPVAMAPTTAATAQLADKKLESDKTGAPLSEDIVALYDEEGANSASDAGISTNEDGLYAIKM